MQPQKGFMLVCDGSNGAGKTTVIKTIVSYLESKGREVVITREPGGTPISEEIRELLLNAKNTEMCDTTELLLFGASRAQHVQEKILPALKAGKVVVSDRFDSATVSFQHYARGLSLDKINVINELALDGFKADMTIILDLDPLVGLERVQSRGEGLDRMEDQKLEFLQNARNGYLKQADQSPERFAVVDASLSIDDVAEQVLTVVDQLLEE